MERKDVEEEVKQRKKLKSEGKDSYRNSEESIGEEEQEDIDKKKEEMDAQMDMHRHALGDEECPINPDDTVFLKLFNQFYRILSIV